MSEPTEDAILEIEKIIKERIILQNQIEEHNRIAKENDGTS
jgi:hypothetical protein